MSLLDDIKKSVDSMSVDDIKAEFEAIKASEAKRREAMRTRNADPEVKAKRLEYSKAYRDKNPEKFKAQRQAYMQKPEVKERMKAYRADRNAKVKAILAKAKELGIG
jgi:hypothetical protein